MPPCLGSHKMDIPLAFRETRESAAEPWRTLLVRSQALAEQHLALLGSLATVLLHPPEHASQVAIALPFGVSRVLLEPPDVLQAEVRHGNQVVVLVLRAA